MMRFVLRLLWVVGACVGAVACQRPDVIRQESYVFGTRVEIAIAETDSLQHQRALAAVLREFDRLHQKFQSLQGDGALARANQHFELGVSTTVDEEFAEVVESAQRFSDLSEGWFNPAIGRMVALWGFNRLDGMPHLPDMEALQRIVAAKPSLADVTVDAHHHISSVKPQVALDFGGYLKGWSLDRAAMILRQHGIRNALINIGGNVMALGTRFGQPWRVGIQHARRPEALAIVELHDGEAIGTSGDYQRYIVIDGQKYCHLVNPRDGSATCDRASATVIAPAAVDAGARSDAASKPLYFASEHDAVRLAAQLGVQAFLLQEADGRIWVSEAMRTRLIWPSSPPEVTVLSN